MISFSKLTYSFIIIHPIVSRMILLSSDLTVHLSSATIVSHGLLRKTILLLRARFYMLFISIFQIIYYFGLAVITFASSFLLYIIFQAPVEELLRTIYHRSHKKNTHWNSYNKKCVPEMRFDNCFLWKRRKPVEFIAAFIEIYF